MNTNLPLWSKKIVLLLVFSLTSYIGFADDNLYREARVFQRGGQYDEAIDAFKTYLMQPANEDSLTKQQIIIYTEALVQLMNTFQSKGEPEACICTLKEVFEASPILQKQCLRDYYSVLGYALSRTEKMKEAEDTMLKVFTIPLHHPTPERYFRDYAYAAAVFYCNPQYQKEVIEWCEEALHQVELCKNTSGKQWVSAMLGSLYKRNGNINKALELFQQSKVEAEERADDLGLINSLHSLIDLFLYWDVPEYANLYASEAIEVERNMTTQNPMISAQTYINKGRALLQLGERDSVIFYTEKARDLCQQLPYNSGMVDVDLLHGIYLTDMGDDSTHLGIQILQEVTMLGTDVNRAKAYHQLAKTYLRDGEESMAELMLDSMYMLLSQNDTPIYIHLDYESILNHYLKTNNKQKIEQYTRMMLQEDQAQRERRLHYNLVEAIVDSQTEQQRRELQFSQLKQANQLLVFVICIVLFVFTTSLIIALLFYQRRVHKKDIQQADDKLATLSQELMQTNVEKEEISQKVDEIMDDINSRQELETLTPSLLQKKGEPKFRQRFELLYPLFLPRLRERIPTITRREELLSMLIVLKQDNKEIAELLAIAPRSVLMLRHRFRQKIGIDTEHSLESFIEDTLGQPIDTDKAPLSNDETSEA